MIYSRPLRTALVGIFLLITAGSARAQTFDISSGGQPTITGALNGSVTGSADTAANLAVTINFGEISPVNRSSIVRVTVPILIRSTQAYQITADLTGVSDSNPRAVQATDTGFGIRNFRASGSKSQICAAGSHVVSPALTTDPQSGAAIDGSTGRVAYPASLANLLTAPVLLSGPKLTQDNGRLKRSDDGYLFDAVFVVTPQFFASGTATAQIIFSISAGTNTGC